MSEQELIAGLEKLRKLASGLPPKLNSDWDGTNHYELTSSGKSGEELDWWLMAGEGVDDHPNACESEEGKRLGLIMDIAAEVGRLRDEGII